MIKLDRDVCNDFDEAASREWLETNGIGGFASGTVSGANSRRYHGILTAATRPPLGRVTMVSKVEETLTVDGERFELSANEYVGNIHPRGFEFIDEFRLDPFPTWTFRLGDVRLEKRLFMSQGSNTTVIRYKLLNGKELKGREIMLEVRPLIAFTDYHHLRRETDELRGEFEAADGVVTMRPLDELPEVHFAHNGIKIEKTGYWYRNFQYGIETERGFDSREDLFQPFSISYDLKVGADIIVSTSLAKATDASKLEKAEVKRRNKLLGQADIENDLARQLVLAADQFVVKRGKGHTIIAGYPWFSDWGRDTMIALRGLTLATGRLEIARNIILEFSKHISEGMLPNRFPDAGDEAEYNTVDATLWYFEAVRAYAEATGDNDLVHDELYDKLADIIVWHMRGTRYGIHVDTDGLLFAGEPGVQLTWMDAKIGDHVVTPRTGKAVEIQALWFNALRTMANFAERFGHDEDATKFDAMADLARQNFNGAFWNEDEQCLFDVIENGTRDASVRPNQLLAISLAYPILNENRWPAVVKKTEDELLTPVGLRSLTPRDPAFVPVYSGSPFDRDSAYHQGTVWGWLIGPFIDAYIRVHSGEAGLDERISEFLKGFETHLLEAGLGQVSEIFDAVPPHSPRGCPAQAWSVAELLRVLAGRQSQRTVAITQQPSTNLHNSRSV